jgi:glutathione S-transferase
MQLYVDSQFASPYAMSAFVALVEKAVDFELMPIDLAAGGQRSPRYTALSLTSRVPMMVDGSFSLSESSAIAEYLEETRPGPRLYPAHAQARARARQVQAWLRSDFLPIRQERTTEVIFFGRAGEPLSEEAAASARRLYLAAQNLLTEGHDHLFGEWSIADLDLALMLNRLRLAGDPMPARLAHYAQQQWARPSVQRWLRQKRAE